MPPLEIIGEDAANDPDDGVRLAIVLIRWSVVGVLATGLALAYALWG
jgi:hypothetical protein